VAFGDAPLGELFESRCSVPAQLLQVRENSNFWSTHWFRGHRVLHKLLARPWGPNQRGVLCGLRASKASTLRSRECSVRSVLRVLRSQRTRSSHRRSQTLDFRLSAFFTPRPAPVV